MNLTDENRRILEGAGVDQPETVAEFRMMRDTLDDLMNAVRAAERERAAEVVRKVQPFIPYDAKCWKDEIGGDLIEVRKVAAAYLADNQSPKQGCRSSVGNQPQTLTTQGFDPRRTGQRKSPDNQSKEG